MTELHHFHPAHKGSGSLCPFSIYPLYTRTVILSLDKPIADCFLFRPRKSREKRRKRSHINASNASVIRVSTPPAQTAHVRFHERKWVHTRLCSKDRTQGHTRRNRGRFGWGWYHYSRSVPHVHQHPRAGYQNGKFCRFWGLVGGAPKKRREPSGQRCAHACRCPEGVAAPLGCVIFFRFCRNYGFHTLCSGLSACARHRRYHYPRRALRASKTLDSRLSKRLICRFLASPM